MTKENPIFAFINKNRPLQTALTIILPILIYWFILVNRYPYPLRPLSMAVRYSLTFVLPSLFVFFLLIFLAHNWWGRLLQVSGTLAIFALALAGLWAKGESEYYIISGLVPFVDAGTYLTEARRILAGMQFTDFAAWRPLFPAFLAPLLALTQQNLQVTLAVLVFIAAISSLLLCLEIRRTHGAAAAAFAMTILFLYYRRFSGAVIPENLGLSLGCLGFALLWRGAHERKRVTVLFGVFLTSLALFCRLGAFFVLPVLVIWAGLVFRESRRFCWRASAWSLGAISAAFILFLGAGFIFSGTVKLPVSYYSTVFYDLASGYPTKYGQVNEEYPQLAELPEAERSAEVYRLAWQRIQDQPQDILQGAASQWKLFFSYTWYAVYGFLIAGSQWVTLVLYAGMYLLCIAAILAWIRNPGDELLSLTIFTTLAIILSVPFVPPQLHNRIRMYASSIPALVVLPAMGFYTLLSLVTDKFKPKAIMTPASNEFSQNFTAWSGISIIAFLLIGSMGVLLFRQAPVYTDIECTEGQQIVYLQYAADSQVNVIPEHIFMIDWLPNFHNGKFRWYLHSTPHYNAIAEMENIVHPPSTLYNGMDLKSGNQVVLIADSNLYPQTPSLMAVCGKWSEEANVDAYHLFYGENITLINSD